MATAPSTTPYFTAPYSFPAPIPTSSTTFPPPQIHGYYYPPPFPYLAYAPGPVFHPPPCVFGAPAPPFPFHYPPDPTLVLPNPYHQVHAPPPESPAPPTIGAPANSTTPATAPLHRPDQVPGAPLPTDLYSPTPRLLDAIPTTTPSSPSANLFSSKVDQLRPFLAYDGNDPASPTTVNKRQPDRAPAAITDLAPLFKVHDRETDAIQRHATAAAASTPGLFSGATTSPTLLYSPTTTAPTPLSCFTPSAGSTTTASTTSSLFSSAPSVFPVSASTAPLATAYAAPQVFDEMPTPVSWQETHGIASDHCSGHHNLIQSTCESETNLSEQNRDGMPQAYGLHNLNCRSVFRADGTEHNFYALPENYPLERATPKPLFSNESVGVFASNLEQQPYEEAQQDSEQHPKCFSKPSESLLPEVVSEFTLTDNVGVSVARYIKFKHGQCFPQVLEYAYTPGCAMGDILLKDYKWNMSLSEEAREIWDPGVSAPLYSSQAKPPRGLSYVEMGLPNVLNLCNQVGTRLQKLRDPQLNVLVTSERREEWDPGDHSILNSTLNRDMLAVASCVSQQIYCTVPPSQENSEIQFEWDPGILSIMDMMLGKTTGPNGEFIVARNHASY